MLHRLEQHAWLASSEGDSENNRRAKYNKLTAAARRQFAVETEQSTRVVDVMRVALESS